MGCRLFAQSTTRHVVVSAGLAWAALLMFGCPAGKEENFVVGTPDAAESVGERLFLERVRLFCNDTVDPGFLFLY